MESPGALGRRRGTTKVSAEDQALDQIAKEVSHLFSFPCRLPQKPSQLTLPLSLV